MTHVYVKFRCNFFDSFEFWREKYRMFEKLPKRPIEVSVASLREISPLGRNF
jgi:hypothetical protein